jgi:predicted DNA-binding transcriptional regulator YafY
MLPPGIVPYLRRAAGEGLRVPFGPGRERGKTLALLEQGLLERRKVSITYTSASRGDAVSERVIAPYYLLPYERSWLVIADDSLRGQVRMFKVDRIRRCQLTSQSYDIPADFEVTSYLGPTWGVLRGQSGPMEDVVVRFSPQGSPWVRDERWHPSQEIEDVTGGGIVMRFHCSVTHELVRWVLSYGAEVTVQEPKRLRDMVLGEARLLLRGGEEMTCE